MVNQRKNKIVKSVWFRDELEYKQLINSIETGDRDIVLDLIYEIYKRGDL